MIINNYRHSIKSIFRPLYHSYEIFLYKFLHNSSYLTNYKNIHRNESCLIVGNGPSLKYTPLDNVNEIKSFGMNKINLLFDQVSWRPSYIVCTNKYVAKQNFLFFNSTNIPLFINWTNRYYLNQHKHINFFLNQVGENFSENLPECLYAGGTVTYAALQIAYYMGFKKVFLVGVDHNFDTKGPSHKVVKSKEDDSNHFHKDYFGKGVKWQLPDLEKSERFYKMAKYKFQSDKREIYDATINGKLNVFKKIDFDKIFNYV